MKRLVRWHGSHEVLNEIKDDGLFGGVFGASSESAALSHGPNLHRVTSYNPLRNYELNYVIDGAFKIAKSICDGNEAEAEAIMTRSCIPVEGSEYDSWGLQRLRGELAKQLGYDAVEMRDEHGITWLFLPGCDIVKKNVDDEYDINDYDE